MKSALFEQWWTDLGEYKIHDATPKELAEGAWKAGEAAAAEAVKSLRTQLNEQIKEEQRIARDAYAEGQWAERERQQNDY